MLLKADLFFVFLSYTVKSMGPIHYSGRKLGVNKLTKLQTSHFLTLIGILYIILYLILYIILYPRMSGAKMQNHTTQS